MAECNLYIGTQANKRMCSNDKDLITDESITKPVVVDCEESTTCYNESTITRMYKENPRHREYTPLSNGRWSADAKNKLNNMTGNSPYALNNLDLGATRNIFSSPSRFYSTRDASRDLLDELRNYRPRTIVSPNVDIFSAIKGNLFDNVYSYAHTPRVNLNPRDRAGNTPLITALLDNNNKAAALLIVKGANVNTSNNAGLTPLMAAASNNNELMVDILLKKGANKSAKTINGMVAADFASDIDVKLLMQKTTTRSKSRSKSKKRSKSRSKRKPCKAGQVRDRSTKRCRKARR